MSSTDFKRNADEVADFINLKLTVLHKVRYLESLYSNCINHGWSSGVCRHCSVPSISSTYRIFKANTTTTCSNHHRMQDIVHTYSASSQDMATSKFWHASNMCWICLPFP